MVKDEKLKIEFIGSNADNVTGSMTWIHDKEFSFLIEAGLFQSNDLLGDYRINNRNFEFSVKKLDFIILGHIHADHSMLVPRLVAEGFRGRIIMPQGSKEFYKLMGLDSAYIVDRDCEALEKKYKKPFHRMYTVDDVFESLELIDEYPMYKKYEVTNRLSIQYTPSGHIINSAQIELWVKNKNKNKTTKILYTSDLGNIRIPKYYANTFEPIERANIVIGESTYSSSSREVKMSTREKDLYKMKEIIRFNEGIVEIPIFTLDRCPNILTIIYDMFHKDKTFKKDIVVDSPLAVKMLYTYLDILEGDDLRKLQDVLEWKNLRLIQESNSSKEYMKTAKDCVVLTASGMMTKGRSRRWLKHILPSDKNVVMFVGFSAENTLAGKIKRGKETSTLNIDGKDYPNRCRIVDLKSFTSHMQYSDMLDYYSNIQADKVALVHGNFKEKCEFGSALQEEISKKNGSAKVVVVNKSTVINL